MGYLIFSDESGRWSDYEGSRIYTRSFIVIHPDVYAQKRQFILENYENLVSNVKWTSSGIVRSNQDLCSHLFRDAHIFIAFTDMNQFVRKGYRIREAIDHLPYGELMGGFQEPFELQRYLRNKADQLLFLNIYEKQFLIRFRESAVEHISDWNICKIFFDNPQQNSQDFAVIAREVLSLDSVQVEITKQSQELGFVIADFVAGCFNDLLLGNNRRGAEIFYRNYILPSSITGTSVNPNPSYQFWPDGDDQYKRILNSLRSYGF